MPKLTDFRKTKIIALPSYPDSQVEIYDSLLVGDAIGTANFEPGKQLQIMLDVLPKLIKSWNFTGEDNKPLDITVANLNFLKADDVAYLLQEITAFSEEAKKK